MPAGTERRDRPLTVFASDPSLGRRSGNHLTLRLPFETVKPGPIGRYVAVVEPAQYPAVDLEDSAILLAGGLPPSEFDVCFHQQMVYAVATHTIDLFQNALGRAIRWPWGDRLRLFPHSGDGDRTDFDFGEGAIHFGYFFAPREVGPPSQRIYTCLSFDTVMHAVVRALVTAVGRPEAEDGSLGKEDRLRAASWVEGIATLLPLLHHFTRLDAVLATVSDTNGRIDGDNRLRRFAPQLSEARRHLRTDAGPHRPADQIDAEERGSVLVDAVLDALVTVSTQRSADLLRIAEPSPTALRLHPDLAMRIAREVVKSARRFLVMCIRAVDYCPPGPVASGDYLRALVTVSNDFAPDREDDRAALISAFCGRGLVPESARSFVEEGVRWSSVPAAVLGGGAPIHLAFEVGTDQEMQANQRLLTDFLTTRRAGLGLSPDLPVTIDQMPDRLSERLATNGAVLREAVVMASQPDGLRATVLVDHLGAVRHVISNVAPVPGDDPVSESRPAEAPTVRPLAVYAFDPSQGQQFGNMMTFQVPYEPLEPGPIGQQVAVIDYDAPNERYYKPADLEEPSALGAGLELRDDDPRFHQQMVYAVASETIRRFEFGLGRKISWSWKGIDADDPVRDRLRILPHAFQEPNAFYDGTIGALLFGYFLSQPGDELVFTCLSHDIVAHETTHALVDNVRPLLLAPTGPDVLAFHEAFADIVALLQHFSFREALYETVLRTGGRIHAASLDPEVAPRDDGSPRIQADLKPTNPLVEVAKQFGEAIGTRKALRQAIGTAPDEYRLDTVDEPHERGSILVAAVFDAFFTVYVRRTADLLRLAWAGRGVSAWGDLHPDLAARLTREAAKTARHFLTICVRALDYLPPVDVTFGDFLRAILTSDADIVPDDPWKYRAALIYAFRSRGIRTEGISGTSEAALRWPAVEEDLRVDSGGAGSSPSPFDGTREEIEARLLAFAEAERDRLGLVPDVPIGKPSFDLQDTRRIDPSIGLRQREFVAQFVQERTVMPAAQTSPVRGGTTVLFWADGRARYVISRPLPSEELGATRQEAFEHRARMNLADAPFTSTAPEPPLARLHRGW